MLPDNREVFKAAFAELNSGWSIYDIEPIIDRAESQWYRVYARKGNAPGKTAEIRLKQQWKYIAPWGDRAREVLSQLEEVSNVTTSETGDGAQV